MSKTYQPLFQVPWDKSVDSMEYMVSTQKHYLNHLMKEHHLSGEH